MIVKDRTLIVKDRPVMHILFYPVAQHSQHAEHQQRGSGQQQQTRDEKDHVRSGTDSHR